MLYPKIVELSTDKATGETFVLVHFWKSEAARARRDKPFLINSHVMHLRPTGERPIDPNNPGAGKEVYDRDVVAQIMYNIRRYVAAAEQCGYEGDHSSADAVTSEAFFEGGKMIRRKGMPLREPNQRDESDPLDILAKPEVAALRGKDIDLEAPPRPR